MSHGLCPMLLKHAEFSMHEVLIGMQAASITSCATAPKPKAEQSGS